MKEECIISDPSFPLEQRCSRCLEVIDGADYTTSQKSYAICYLTYRHLLDGYFIDREFLFTKLDFFFKEPQISKFEEVRWRISILTARLYLSGSVTDIWWWNYGTKEKLNTNPFSIINFLRLINLSIAFNLNNDIFIEAAYKHAIELYKHFYSVIQFDKLPNFIEVNIAEQQIKITLEFYKYLSSVTGGRKSFTDIVNLDKTEPFHSLLKKTLKL